MLNDWRQSLMVQLSLSGRGLHTWLICSVV